MFIDKFRKLIKEFFSKQQLFNQAEAKEEELTLMKQKLENLNAELAMYKTWVPPGHYYSPIPDINQIKTKEGQIFNKNRDILAVEMNDKEQISFFEQVKKFYGELEYQPQKIPNLRYYYGADNDQYSYSDAICLYSMIRHLEPKRIVEIGSGYSSCVTLDTNERFFDNNIFCTFIDPYPGDRFLKLIKDGDLKKNVLIQKNLQDVDLEIFSCLESGDVLFVDSTHVSKTDSDVNHIFFEILPRLKSGVCIHFHDIPYPFEYPEEWVYEGRAWNEVYMLRAFLQYNAKFRIVFFNTYFCKMYRQMVMNFAPGLMHLGASIWLRKE